MLLQNGSQIMFYAEYFMQWITQFFIMIIMYPMVFNDSETPRYLTLE